MFRKQAKKEFPPGTFIPTPARVAVIIQLCLAFSLLLWEFSEPFMGDLFRIKSQLLLYHDVMGIKIVDNTTQEHIERLQRNAERFENLPKNEKYLLIEKQAALQEKLNSSFSQKIERLIKLFAHEISAYEQAWILFSITLCLLLLKRFENAQHAVWILPTLALLFLWDNQMYAHGSNLEVENSFYPSEKEIVQNYLRAPLEVDILKQREQLLLGWNLYLIKKWTQEPPHADPIIFHQQAEKGEFLFNVMRLLKMKNPIHDVQKKTPFFILFLYLVWNLFFTWFVNRHMRNEKALELT